MCKLLKMQLCGNTPTAHTPPLGSSAMGESHRHGRSKMLLFILPPEPHWKAYEIHLECVYFCLKEKNSNAKSCDDKHVQHPALTNCMKSILLAEEILT